MLKRYVSAISKVAFRPTVRWTDGISILASVALPALYQALGWPMPADFQGQVFAYIGYFVVTLFVLRLVFFAPYQAWRDAQESIARMQVELEAAKNHEAWASAKIRVEVQKSLIQKRTEIAPILARIADHDEQFPFDNYKEFKTWKKQIQSAISPFVSEREFYDAAKLMLQNMENAFFTLRATSCNLENRERFKIFNEFYSFAKFCSLAAHDYLIGSTSETIGTQIFKEHKGNDPSQKYSISRNTAIGEGIPDVIDITINYSGLKDSA